LKNKILPPPTTSYEKGKIGEFQYSETATLGEMSIEPELENANDYETISLGKMTSEEIDDKKMEATIEGGMSYSDYYEVFLEEEVISNKKVDSESDFTKKSQAKVFPNPATELTTFEFNVLEKGIFKIALYDMSGKMLQEIHSGRLNKGNFNQNLDLKGLDSGMYLIIIHAENINESVKFLKK
jgi:hypothetical protein